jgi:hypothetical protein
MLSSVILMAVLISFGSGNAFAAGWSKYKPWVEKLTREERVTLKTKFKESRKTHSEKDLKDLKKYVEKLIKKYGKPKG